MSSKQLESIMGRVVKATPALNVVASTPEPAVSEAAAASAPKPRQSVPAQPAVKARRGEGRDVETRPAVLEPERAIQAYVPVSVAKAINIRAAQEDATVRSIILQGLKAIGFEISDEQIRDRRR